MAHNGELYLLTLTLTAIERRKVGEQRNQWVFLFFFGLQRFDSLSPFIHQGVAGSIDYWAAEIGWKRGS